MYNEKIENKPEEGAFWKFKTGGADTYGLSDEEHEQLFHKVILENVQKCMDGDEEALNLYHIAKYEKDKYENREQSMFAEEEYEALGKEKTWKSEFFHRYDKYFNFDEQIPRYLSDDDLKGLIKKLPLLEEAVKVLNDFLYARENTIKKTKTGNYSEANMEAYIKTSMKFPADIYLQSNFIRVYDEVIYISNINTKKEITVDSLIEDNAKDCIHMLLNYLNKTSNEVFISKNKNIIDIYAKIYRLYDDLGMYEYYNNLVEAANKNISIIITAGEGLYGYGAMVYSGKDFKRYCIAQKDRYSDAYINGRFITIDEAKRYLKSLQEIKIKLTEARNYVAKIDYREEK